MLPSLRQAVCHTRARAHTHTHIFAHSVSALAQPWSQAGGQRWSLPWELLTQWESKQVNRQLSRRRHSIMGWQQEDGPGSLGDEKMADIPGMGQIPCCLKGVVTRKGELRERGAWSCWGGVRD